MKISEFVSKHQYTGIKGQSWDDPKGFYHTCACGWEKTYRDMNGHGRHLHGEHLDEEAEKAALGHIPTAVNEMVDSMVENRQGWCRDMRTVDAENFQMNRVFNELKYSVAVMGKTPEELNQIKATEYLFAKGPLGFNKP